MYKNLLDNAIPMVNMMNPNKKGYLIIEKGVLEDGIVKKTHERHPCFGQFQMSPIQQKAVNNAYNMADIFIKAWIFNLEATLVNFLVSVDVGAIFLEVDGKMFKCYNLTDWKINGWIMLEGGMVANQPVTPGPPIATAEDSKPVPTFDSDFTGPKPKPFVLPKIPQR